MLQDLQSTNEQGNKAQDSESNSEEVHEMYRKYCGKQVLKDAIMVRTSSLQCLKFLCFKFQILSPIPLLRLRATYSYVRHFYLK